MTYIAKLFNNGRSQAVRLPAALRFASTENVFIRKDPLTGDIILSQRPGDWDGFFSVMKDTEVPDSFLSPEERRQSALNKDPFEGWEE